MNDALVKNWNECVGAEDKVYHLGDFAFMSKGNVINMLSRLNGKKYFLAGNHDKALFKRDEDFRIELRDEVVPYIEWIKDYHELNIPDISAPRKHQQIVLGHYSMRVWNKSHWGAWNLYGHSHGTLPDEPKALAIDVGVDAVAKYYSKNGVINSNDYRPICYDEIKVIMNDKQFVPIDHHGSRE